MQSHKDGEDERREGVASARAGWKGGVLVERRFLRTRSRWPAEGNEQRLGLVAGEDFCCETVDCDVSAADGVKEGGVGRETKWLPWRVLHSTRGYCDSPGTVGTVRGYCRVLWVLRVPWVLHSTRGYCRVLWVL